VFSDKGAAFIISLGQHPRDSHPIINQALKARFNAPVRRHDVKDDLLRDCGTEPTMD
jgi:hypothetical protein